jgi:hypothetical protein
VLSKRMSTPAGYQLGNHPNRYYNTLNPWG